MDAPATEARIRSAPSLAERVAGGVWGHLVGDAVGVPYEFRSPEQIGEVRFGAQGAHGQPAGTWSDDGAMMLALLDSLLQVGFDPQDQARRYVDWRRKGRYAAGGHAFDIGNTTSTALTRIEDGVPAKRAGGTGEHDNGNGSLMRTIPIALVEIDLPPAELVEHAHRASRVTHGHPRSQVACALYVLAARKLLEGAEREDALSAARDELRALYQERAEAEPYSDALDFLEAWPDRSGRGYVLDSLWSAWDAFAGADSYRQTIERAVAYGHDTDTTACIAGGLAGIHWGVGAIPSEWLNGMRGREIVDPLVEQLVGKTTVETDPSAIRVDWIDPSPWPGRLGMTFLPGKRGVRGLAGAHQRDLAVDADRLRDHWGTQTFLLLVEDRDLEEAGVPNLVRELDARGVEVLRHPIRDRGVPEDREAYRRTLRAVTSELKSGRRVVVACMGGLGRTGTTAACLLREAGLDADEAIQRTRSARRYTIETGAQEEFVRAWASG